MAPPPSYRVTITITPDLEHWPWPLPYDLQMTLKSCRVTSTVCGRQAAPRVRGRLLYHWSGGRPPNTLWSCRPISSDRRIYSRPALVNTALQWVVHDYHTVSKSKKQHNVTFRCLLFIYLDNYFIITYLENIKKIDSLVYFNKTHTFLVEYLL